MSKHSGKRGYTPNDQRAIVMNPTSREYTLDQANRATQAAEPDHSTREAGTKDKRD